MADPATVKVLHGADYDVTTLKRDFGFTFSSLFDTMVAARFLGMPEVGLQAVARTELGVSLSKDSQRDDWSRRPLTPKQEAYAAADVAHLIALHERLDAKLEALGRRAWVREECDAVAALAPSRRDRDPDAFLRVKGANRLSPESLRIFANLYGWREGLGAEADVPTFKIVGNSTLLDLATARPKTPEDLGKIKGLPPRLRERGLLDVIRKASAEPPITPPRRPREVPTDAERARNEALRAWRAEAAKGLGLDVSAVLPQRLIDRLAKENPSTAGGLEGVEGLRRWRIQTFGTRILEKLAAARPS
jgi:ribonuclease D